MHIYIYICIHIQFYVPGIKPTPIAIISIPDENEEQRMDTHERMPATSTVLLYPNNLNIVLQTAPLNN